MEIRQIKNIDEALSKLWEFDQDHQRINFPKDNPNYEKFKETILKEYKEEPEGFFFVYEDKTIIGLLRLKIYYNAYRKQKYGEVRNIHLDPINRGKGYGKKLLEFADKYFKEKGCGYASAGVSALNPSSSVLFEKCGYGITRKILEKDY